MHLDVYTLFIFELYILILLTGVMLFAWIGGRRDPTLGLMALMLAFATAGTQLSSMRSDVNDIIPVLFSNLLILLCYGIMWSAVRVFTGRRIILPGVFAGPLIWAFFCLSPDFYHSLSQRILLTSLLTAAYTLMTTVELWHVRRQLNVTFWPALPLSLFHAGFYLMRPVFDDGLPYAEMAGGHSSGFFAILIFEAILYAICLTFIILAMVYERGQLSYKLASLRDPLTGVGNRRAFLEFGNELIRKRKNCTLPLQLMLFDLDNFKKLNDQYGHAGGDSALIFFCSIVNSLLEKKDVFARIGGEEFACLTSQPKEQAIKLAETIRVRLAQSSQHNIPMTVSVGIAFSDLNQDTISHLLIQADHALYRAKSAGKNRIELS
ncbi:sensor domain-containing diguanylate cyclase [Rahnella laticis]|uniref:GGDEF domain-containing protein n=1 Tax=Rahnella laticis TaxID=2787622 RepID=UPI0018A2A39B|nr:GGDEF domain-containing protein [Rahnella laticis]MBF7993188.1 GGDEF domain-containing protein [Rahnella laticis]